MARIKPSPTTAPVEQFASAEPPKPKLARNLLNLPPSPVFFLKYHPARWGVIGGQILPILGRLAVSPGVGAVDKRGDTALAEAEAAKRGWRVIPWEAIQILHPERSTYVKVYEGKRGKVHLTMWETPRAVGGRVRVHVDEEGYHEWLRALIDEGIIPPPDPDIVDALLEQADSVIARTQDRGGYRLEAARRRKAELEQAIAATEAVSGGGDA